MWSFCGGVARSYFKKKLSGGGFFAGGAVSFVWSVLVLLGVLLIGYDRVVVCSLDP